MFGVDQAGLKETSATASETTLQVDDDLEIKGKFRRFDAGDRADLEVVSRRRRACLLQARLIDAEQFLDRGRIRGRF